MTQDLPAAVAAAYATAPSPQRETMLEMRERILELLPGATEAMKYGMPTFIHEGTAVMGLLANKQHVGLYPYSGSVIGRLPEIGERYGTTKGAIHLPPDAPMPKALLRKLVRARLEDVPETKPRAVASAGEGDWAALGVPGAPARRALMGAGLKTVKQVAKQRRADVAALHGMGPKALGVLDALLVASGLGWKPMTVSSDTSAGHRIFTMSFASVYPAYVAKLERKGRTVAELHTVITWLTGFDDAAIARHLKAGITIEEFFGACTLNPHVGLITGSVCGVKVQEVADPLMRQIRYLDKLVDELANGRPMEKVLRG